MFNKFALIFVCTEEFLHPTHDDDLGEFGGLDLHDRVAKLERQVKQQQDEITCLRTALADVVRRLACVENNKYSPRGKSHWVEVVE